MPVPGLSEIATTTLRNRSGKLADNMTRNNAIFTRLNTRGRRKYFSGGRTIVRELAYLNNQTYQRYSGYQTLNISPSPAFSAAEFPIRQVAIAVSMSGLEQLQNAGKEQSIALLESRIENAEETFQNGFSYDLYSDGSLTGQISGLGAIVAASPSTGTLGGIDRATWSFWRNISYSALTNGGAPVNSANIQDYMLALYQQLVRGADSPDLIMADNTTWAAYHQSLMAIARLTKADSDVAKAGFKTLDYMGADVVMDGGYQGTLTDGNNFGASGAAVVGGMASGNMVFLNTKYLYLMTHSERDFVPLEPDRFSMNQDAMVKLMAWAGNLCASCCFLQGRLTT